MDNQPRFEVAKHYYPEWNDKEGKYLMRAVVGTPNELNKISTHVSNTYGATPDKINPLVAALNGFSNTMEQTPALVARAWETINDVWEIPKAMAEDYGNQLIAENEGGEKAHLRLQEGRGQEDQLADYLSSQAKLNAKPISIRAQEHPFSSVEGIMGQLGSVAGMAVQTAVSGRVLGAMGEAAGMTSDAILNLSMYGSGAVINSGIAYDDAKSAGLSDPEASMFAGTLGLVNTVIQNKFGSNMLTKFLVGGNGTKTIENIVMAETGGKLTEESLNKSSQNIFAKVNNAVLQFTANGVPGRAAESAIEGGLFTMANSTAELTYNALNDKYAQYGHGRFDKQLNADAFKEMFGTALVGGISGD